MRQLVPHFFISTQPLGWRCSECEQPFSLNVPMIGDPVRGQDEIPLPVRVLFNSHRCKPRARSFQPRSEAVD